MTWPGKFSTRNIPVANIEGEAWSSSGSGVSGGCTVLIRDRDGDALLVKGTSTPTADTDGYAKGCIFIDTDAADGTKGLYENQGTSSESDFNKIGDLTTSELADSAVTTAKLDDDAVTTAKLDPTTVQYTTVSISAAEVKALNTTPKTLVSAPGANKVLEFVSGVMQMSYSGATLTSACDTTVVLGTAHGSNTVSGTVADGDFLQKTADTYVTVVPLGDEMNPVANKALSLSGSADISNTAMTSTVTAKIAYREHDFS